MNSSSLSKAGLACIAAGLCQAALLLLLLAGLADTATLLVLVGATLSFGLGAWFFLSRSQRSLRQVFEVSKAVAAGDFETRITGIREGGSLGETMWAINDLIDRSDAFLREAAASMDHVERNLYYRRIIETGQIGSFLAGAKTINHAIEATDAKVKNFKAVADGFESTIKEVVDGVSNAARELDSTAASMERTAQATQEQAASVAAAAEEASVNVQTVAGCRRGTVGLDRGCQRPGLQDVVPDGQCR